MGKTEIVTWIIGFVVLATALSSYFHHVTLFEQENEFWGIDSQENRLTIITDLLTFQVRNDIPWVVSLVFDGVILIGVLALYLLIRGD